MYITELDNSRPSAYLTHMDTLSRLSHFVEERGRAVTWHIKPNNHIVCITSKISQASLVRLNEELNTQIAEKKSNYISCEAPL